MFKNALENLLDKIADRIAACIIDELPGIAEAITRGLADEIVSKLMPFALPWIGNP